MDKDHLAAIYFTATQRMHEAVASFYEDCHTDNEGKPKESCDQIAEAVDTAKSSMAIEYDLILTAIQEYNE
tara:strand:+ start:1218 stop:1430 length:213 start_codon:yes stop_codon:yes gene_type:complete